MVEIDEYTLKKYYVCVLKFLLEGVPVEIEDTVDHFHGHFRIPWGRKPP